MGILNLGGSAGSYVRFMPSANAWMHGGAEVQLKQIVFDHASVRTGWGKMAEGSAPEWQWDNQLGVRSPQPSDEHKRGFSIRLYAKAIGVAEWSSTGTGPCMGFDAIFDQIWNEKDANAGKVPVVEYTGSEPIKVGKGNTRKPQFRLVKWVPRENVPWDGDDAQKEAAPAPAPVPKPAPVQKATAPASSGDDDAEF